jgi:osmotically-inducible protein OsmY
MPVAAAETAQKIRQDVLSGLPWDSVVEERVKSPGNLLRTDADIARTVRLTLEWDALLPDQKIRSTVSEGWVSLEGELSTLREKEDAERLVRVLAGVKGVHNLLTVAATSVDRQQLRTSIEEALELEAEREAEKIRVNVEGGTVTLEGRVRTWPEKSVILETVSHAPGVHEVTDHLSVDPRR